MPSERSKTTGRSLRSTTNVPDTSTTSSTQNTRSQGSYTTTCWSRSTRMPTWSASGRRKASRSYAACLAWSKRIPITRPPVSAGCPRPIWRRGSSSCARIVDAGDVPAVIEYLLIVGSRGGYISLQRGVDFLKEKRLLQGVGLRVVGKESLDGY